MAPQPPGITSLTQLLPDPGKENQDQTTATLLKKTNGHSMEQHKDAADAFENKVPEYDMEENNDQVNHAETGDQDLAEIFKENPSTSGPVLVMPGVIDFTDVDDLNSQFTNRRADMDFTIPFQQKP